jgi:phytanoyl-CoA hydroxylase
MLTQTQVKSFERDGFVVSKDLISIGDCEALRDRAAEMIADVDETKVSATFSTTGSQAREEYFLDSAHGIGFFWEVDAVNDNKSLNRPKELAANKFGHAMHDLDPVFDHFSRRTGMGDIAADLGYTNTLVTQSMYIYKQPGIGGEVTLHNDHAFLWTEPMRTLGFWVALEDATIENGCLWALPGGHKIGQRSRFRRDGNGSTLLEEWADDYPTEGLVPLEATTGTVIALHGLLPHRSDTNRSDRSRHAFTLHIIDAEAEWADDNWLQRPTDLPFRGF